MKYVVSLAVVLVMAVFAACEDTNTSADVVADVPVTDVVAPDVASDIAVAGDVVPEGDVVAVEVATDATATVDVAPVADVPTDVAKR